MKYLILLILLLILFAGCDTGKKGNPINPNPPKDYHYYTCPGRNQLGHDCVDCHN